MVELQTNKPRPAEDRVAALRDYAPYLDASVALRVFRSHVTDVRDVAVAYLAGYTDAATALATLSVSMSLLIDAALPGPGFEALQRAEDVMFRCGAARNPFGPPADEPAPERRERKEPKEREERTSVSVSPSEIPAPLANPNPKPYPKVPLENPKPKPKNDAATAHSQEGGAA